MKWRMKKKGLVIDSVGGKISEGEKRLLTEYVCL